MEWDAVVKSIDELLFSETGKHLDDLQLAIIKGVLNGKKYADIAEQYGCTTGHVKDEGYELWSVLSQLLGENLNKGNFCATVERLGLANYQSPIIGNHVRFNNINLCTNPNTSEPEDREPTPVNGGKVEEDKIQDTLQHQVKLNIVPQLVKLGLTAKQIAEVLELPLSEVQVKIK
ncbi:hypothetical protein PJF56_16885 [Roseofilum sp. BLCC_M91]|uniref:vWA-MoxR associated protein N-terminal HTH domain-containing protein n=1 Tax=Roseofilum halophilum BLCC-M91 TaxID=3022259 RepID=A0ABT7BMX8_9CYAN|nr:hypothetical protein [Roseofilum halophilum]MDJ1180538.1 hypothetical protein [Roseofilum halophilum BLCC-M91]